MAQSLTNKNRLLEKYVQVVREDGLNTNKNVNVGINGNSAALWVSGNVSSGGVINSTGGQSQAGSVQTTVFHTGQVSPMAASTSSGTTSVTNTSTTSYVAEVFVPDNTTITGISVLNGSAVAGTTSVGLANAAGTVVAKSATNVSASGTSAYQQIPFTSTYAAIGPAKYFVVVQSSSASQKFIAHTIGNFGATTVTSETYGTFQTGAVYSTTTFTTGVGLIADTY